MTNQQTNLTLTRLSVFKVAIVTISIILLLLISGALYFTHQVVDQRLAVLEPTLVTINKGKSFHHLSKELLHQGIITERFWLRNYARLYPNKAKIKAGTYQFTPLQTVGDMLAMINRGEEHQFYITFVEGTRLSDWLAILAKHPRIKHQLMSKSYAQVSQELNIDEPHPEGLFFPETYAFTDQTSDITILQRAYDRMQNTLANVWQSRAVGLPLESAYQALILASIIEKETADKNEFQRVSSVFVNRLNKNMRLQTDPTVIYGVRERYQGDIKRSHLRDENPYNTYYIKGLPPTPIAMPGLAAMKAAVNPESSDFLYFVSDGNGGHVFSTNFEDHKIALRQFLLKSGH